MTGSVFINRRKGNDRRFDADPCRHMAIDLYHRKRRKTCDRRSTRRTLSDDYYAYFRSADPRRATLKSDGLRN